MATIKEKIANQVTSARWILTVLAGIAFLVFAFTVSYVICRTYTQFKPETLIAMFSALLLVIQGCYKDYFSRGDRQNNNGNDSERKDNLIPPIK